MSDTKYINNENLEKVLRNKHKEENVKVKNFEISMGSKKGDNYTSDIYRVHIDYELNGAPKNTSIIAKYMIEREEAVKFFAEFGLKGKENEMYMEILPKYHELVGVKFGAECYYITDDYVVFFLEDLKSVGFDVADRTLGLDLNHSKLLVEKLGKFHAASMILEQNNPGAFKNFQKGLFFSRKESPFMMSLFESSLKLLLDVARNWDGYENIVKKLENIKENIAERILKCAKQNCELKVLNHGDCWTNNYMFKYPESTKTPTEILFVDYQIGFYSGMGIDLNYFFYSSPKQEIRENYEDYLLESYHKSLIEVLAKKKYSKIPSLHEIKKNFKDFQFYGFFSAVCILPIIVMERNDEVEYNVEALNGSEGELRKLQYEGKNFEMAIKKILLKFDNDGILD